MKIIDLLNKIANGEEVPKAIRFGKIIYEYEEGIDYINGEGLDKKFLIDKICISQEDLNDEIEILDEPKNNSGITLEEHVRVLNAYQELQEKYKKQKEVIDKAIELLNHPWSFESRNKEVDEITHNKKREVIDILKEVSK